MENSQALSPAAFAFDSVANDFDNRFGGWLSVRAQRRAVRRALQESFPVGGRILELGGGTGEDALWLAERGYRVVLTDASPRMVEISTRKLRGYPDASAVVVAAEALEATTLTERDFAPQTFDGAFSNFAALNCVSDLTPVARGLARLIRQNGKLILVVFGTCSPGEVIVELARSRPRSAFRRFTTRPVSASLSGRRFVVKYHRSTELALAMQPWFRAAGRRGIGVFVPPSAAEPWISRHPRLLGALEAMDREVAGVLAPLGDHVLYRFERTSVPVTSP